MSQDPALPRLRWIALITDDLERTSTTAERELGVQRCFTDPEVAEYGMANTVIALGDCFLEICTPIRDDAWPARLLQRQGPGGLLVLFQVETLRPYRERAADLDVRIVTEWSPRKLPAGTWESIQLHPKDAGGMLVSFDACDPPAEFPAVIADWRSAPGAANYTGYTGLHLQSPTPDRMASRWGSLLGREAEDGRIPLADATVTFSGSDGDARLAGLELRSPNPAATKEFDLDSVRIRVVHAG